jgi:hypothetical protein
MGMAVVGVGWCVNGGRDKPQPLLYCGEGCGEREGGWIGEEI